MNIHRLGTVRRGGRGLRALAVAGIGAGAVVAATALPAAADAPVANNVFQIATWGGLQVDVAATTPGAAVIQNTFDYRPSQDWTLVPVSGQPNEYEIQNYTSRLCAEMDGSAVIQNDCDGSTTELWFFVQSVIQEDEGPVTAYAIHPVSQPSEAITAPTQQLTPGLPFSVAPLDAYGAPGFDQLFTLFDIDG